MSTVFVFGSNELGFHGSGAAKTALLHYGAIYGKSYGHYGNSFAIPTKDRDIQTLPLEIINMYVQGFLAFARGHKRMKFKVSRIGCGLAGYSDSQIAPMFKGASTNCCFDIKWRNYLGDDYAYFSYEGSTGIGEDIQQESVDAESS